MPPSIFCGQEDKEKAVMRSTQQVEKRQQEKKHNDNDKHKNNNNNTKTQKSQERRDSLERKTRKAKRENISPDKSLTFP